MPSIPINVRIGCFFTLIVVIGCSCNAPQESKTPQGDQPEKRVPNQPEQRVSVLNEADQKHLRDQRAVVERYLGNEDSKQKYKTAAGKLGTIRSLLNADTFKRSQAYELQCLGVVLGDVLVQDLGMEWIVVEDELGRSQAVRLPNSTIIVYPISMISKRVERGEKVDVFELYNRTAEEVDTLQRKPK